MTLVRRAFAEACSVSLLLVVTNIVCYKIVERSLLSSAALTVFGVKFPLDQLALVSLDIWNS